MVQISLKLDTVVVRRFHFMKRVGLLAYALEEFINLGNPELFLEVYFEAF